jgi:hypothetical protein
MPEAPLPFIDKQTSGQAELAGGITVAMNVVVDQLGAVYRRPGVTALAGVTPSVIDAGGISGIYKTLGGQIYAIGDTLPARPIYLVGAGGAAKLGAGVFGTRRPIFAETEMLLVIAAGADVKKVVLVGNVLSNLGGAPPLATHVLANANRLVANDATNDKTKVRFSDQAQGTVTYVGHEQWALTGIGTSGFFTAEGRPDPVVALAEDTNEMLVFGSSTLQSFQPDPNSVYAPLATREVGCSAPYSVTKIDQDFFWLDHLRRFQTGSSRGYQAISDPIQRTLDQMGTISDCYGAYVPIDFMDALVWSFPTDGRTFVFQREVGWGQWAKRVNNNWAPLGITAWHNPQDGGPILVGTSEGKIGTLSFDAATDLGVPISACVTTGFGNRGTEARKWCRCVKLTLRRGTTQDPIGPQAYLRWRNDLGAWEQPLAIDLGASGDREPVVRLSSLGTYRRRQWQFEYSGTEALVLVSATEEFEVLGS